MNTSMQGRRVLITGAGKGIGKGIAEVFAAHGANVFLVARSAGDITRTVEGIRKAGGSASCCTADVSSRDSVQQAVHAAVEYLGGLDVLCANAGIFPNAPLETMTDEQWDTVIDTNLKGTFLTVQACIPALKMSGTGRVVLTSSITGPVTGYPGWSHYAASKAGQLGFMRTAALELAPYGITVNAIQPGNIMTEGLADAGQDYLTAMTAAIPMRRLGLPADIGHTALFLGSAEAGFITGQGIVVDGGQILPENLEAIK